MVAGRPRTAIPEKQELIELGKDLVKWAAEPTKGKEIRCRYCEWYTAQGFVMKQWEHMREKPEFQWYYEQARSLLGKKYIDGTINASIAHRFLRRYCPEVKDQEDQDAKEEIARNKEGGAVTDETMQSFTALMSQVAGLQKPSDAKPLADTTSSDSHSE